MTDSDFAADALAELEEVSSSAYPSLERKPGKSDNWVEKAGGLPSYIERIAKHLHYEKGKPIGTAIASAVNTTKRWCSTGKNWNGGDLKADTKAKACAAVASWEAKKGKSKAKSLAEAAEVPEDQPLTEDDRGSLIEFAEQRLVLVEGFLMTLDRQDATSAAVETAVELLESVHSNDMKLRMGGVAMTSAETLPTRKALAHERSDLRHLLEALGDKPEKKDAADKALEAVGKAREKAAPEKALAAMPDREALNIMPGSTGPAVSKAQQRLTELGYELKDDGQFGEKTENAVKSFQADHDLEVDGKLFRQTRTALRGTTPEDIGERRKEVEDAASEIPDEEEATPESAEEEATPAAFDWLTKGRGVGDQPDPRVGGFQMGLGAMGTYVGPGGADGRFGPETEAATKRIQRRYGLKPDGLGGPKTVGLVERMNGGKLPEWKAASEAESEAPEKPEADVEEAATTADSTSTSKKLSDSAATAKKNGNGGATPPSGNGKFNEQAHPRAKKGNPNGGQFVKSGDSGPAVSGLQKKLGIEANGKFDGATEAAVRAYQEKNGLEVDGVVGSQTAASLAGRSAKPGKLSEGDRRSLKKAARGNGGVQPGDLDMSTGDEGASSGSDSSSSDSAEGDGEGSSEAASVGGTLGKGASGEAVSAIQEALGIDPTGEFDAETLKAVREYQRDNGLVVDGIVGAQTVASLRGEEADPGELTSSDREWLNNYDETDMEEASLRGAVRSAVKGLRDVLQIKRLPDGTFAPKGRGQVLIPGMDVKVPHKSGTGTVTGTVSKTGSHIELKDGPDKGGHIAVSPEVPRTPSKSGQSSPGFFDPETILERLPMDREQQLAAEMVAMQGTLSPEQTAKAEAAMAPLDHDVRAFRNKNQTGSLDSLTLNPNQPFSPPEDFEPVTIPKGTPALWVGGFAFPTEAEIALPKGTKVKPRKEKRPVAPKGVADVSFLESWKDVWTAFGAKGAAGQASPGFGNHEDYVEQAPQGAPEQIQKYLKTGEGREKLRSMLPGLEVTPEEKKLSAKLWGEDSQPVKQGSVAVINPKQALGFDYMLERAKGMGQIDEPEMGAYRSLRAKMGTWGQMSYGQHSPGMPEGGGQSGVNTTDQALQRLDADRAKAYREFMDAGGYGVADRTKLDKANAAYAEAHAAAMKEPLGQSSPAFKDKLESILGQHEGGVDRAERLVKKSLDEDELSDEERDKLESILGQHEGGVDRAERLIAKELGQSSPAGIRSVMVDPASDTREVIDVGDDVNRAADLLAQGKKVQLSQPRTVSTLLDELKARVDRAIEAGENAPNFNLCDVSVPNTNLFCAESKGVARLHMPQLKGIPLPGSKADAMDRDKRGEVDLAQLFREHLASQGIAIEDTTEKAGYLRATQNELNGAKVAGIARAMLDGVKIKGALFVSRDNYVVDGHHRWAASIGVDVTDGEFLGGGKDEGMPMEITRIDMDILDILDASNEFAAEYGLPQVSVGDPRGGAAPSDAPGKKGQSSLSIPAPDRELAGRLDASPDWEAPKIPAPTEGNQLWRNGGGDTIALRTTKNGGSSWEFLRAPHPDDQHGDRYWEHVARATIEKKMGGQSSPSFASTPSLGNEVVAEDAEQLGVPAVADALRKGKTPSAADLRTLQDKIAENEANPDSNYGVLSVSKNHVQRLLGDAEAGQSSPGMIDGSPPGMWPVQLSGIDKSFVESLGSKRREANITGGPGEDAEAAAERVRNYLPSNYVVIGTSPDGGSDYSNRAVVRIAGKDEAGWTLEDYVLPRLASGLMFGKVAMPYGMNSNSGQASPGTPEIDWKNIADAGVSYGDSPSPIDTVTGSFPEYDQDGIRNEQYRALSDLADGEWATDPEGRRFQRLGHGSVQGSVILRNENGDQFHASIDTHLKPEGQSSPGTPGKPVRVLSLKAGQKFSIPSEGIEGIVTTAPDPESGFGGSAKITRGGGKEQDLDVAIGPFTEGGVLGGDTMVVPGDTGGQSSPPWFPGDSRPDTPAPSREGEKVSYRTWKDNQFGAFVDGEIVGSGTVRKMDGDVPIQMPTLKVKDAKTGEVVEVMANEVKPAGQSSPSTGGDIPGYGSAADMSVSQLIDVVKQDWQNPNYAAVPYIEALSYTPNMDSPYGVETARDMVPYFLSNARSWRGPVAKAVKAELNRRLKAPRGQSSPAMPSELGNKVERVLALADKQWEKVNQRSEFVPEGRFAPDEIATLAGMVEGGYSDAGDPTYTALNALDATVPEDLNAGLKELSNEHLAFVGLSAEDLNFHTVAGAAFSELTDRGHDYGAARDLAANYSPGDAAAKATGQGVLFDPSVTGQASPALPGGEIPGYGKAADMSVNQLMDVVRKDWQNPNFGAVPYIDALSYTPDMDSPYGVETARDMVPYFLSNARSWRGPVAKAVKAELNRRLKAPRGQSSPGLDGGENGWTTVMEPLVKGRYGPWPELRMWAGQRISEEYEAEGWGGQGISSSDINHWLFSREQTGELAQMLADDPDAPKPGQASPSLEVATPRQARVLGPQGDAFLDKVGQASPAYKPGPDHEKLLRESLFNWIARDGSGSSSSGRGGAAIKWEVANGPAATGPFFRGQDRGSQPWGPDAAPRGWTPDPEVALAFSKATVESSTGFVREESFGLDRRVSNFELRPGEKLYANLYTADGADHSFDINAAFRKLKEQNVFMHEREIVLDPKTVKGGREIRIKLAENTSNLRDKIIPGGELVNALYAELHAKSSKDGQASLGIGGTPWTTVDPGPEPTADWLASHPEWATTREERALATKLWGAASLPNKGENVAEFSPAHARAFSTMLDIAADQGKADQGDSTFQSFKGKLDSWAGARAAAQAAMGQSSPAQEGDLFNRIVPEIPASLGRNEGNISLRDKYTPEQIEYGKEQAVREWKLKNAGLFGPELAGVEADEEEARKWLDAHPESAGAPSGQSSPGTPSKGVSDAAAALGGGWSPTFVERAIARLAENGVLIDSDIEPGKSIAAMIRASNIKPEDLDVALREEFRE